MKIQINSLEALERLIGGDSSLEIEIRNSVVQDFTKKHLKPLATLPVMNTVAEAIKSEILNGLVEYYKDGWQQKVRLTKDAESLLATKIDNVFASRINKLVENAVNSNVHVVRMNGIIANAAHRVEHQYSEAILKGRLDKMVDAKIKERLGI